MGEGRVKDETDMPRGASGLWRRACRLGPDIPYVLRIGLATELDVSIVARR